MNLRSRVKVGALAIVLVAGSATAVVAGSSDRTPHPGKGNFHINKQGQSYGSAQGRPLVQDRPDLILAYGDDGTLGYVRKMDLERANDKRVIGLYDKEGHRIGKFTIGNRRVTPTK